MARPKGYSPHFGRILSKEEWLDYRAGRLKAPRGGRRKAQGKRKASTGRDVPSTKALLREMERRLPALVEEAFESFLKRLKLEADLNLTLGKRRGRKPLKGTP
jgi:hypothetical protein